MRRQLDGLLSRYRGIGRGAISRRPAVREGARPRPRAPSEFYRPVLRAEWRRTPPTADRASPGGPGWSHHNRDALVTGGMHFGRPPAGSSRDGAGLRAVVSTPSSRSHVWRVSVRVRYGWQRYDCQSLAERSPHAATHQDQPVTVASRRRKGRPPPRFAIWVVVIQENVSFDHNSGTYPQAANPRVSPRSMPRPVRRRSTAC